MDFLYIDASGETLCRECAQEEMSEHGSFFKVEGYWVDTDTHCAECGKRLVSYEEETAEVS